MNAGGNVVVGASSNVPEMIKDLAIEFSVDFDDKGTKVFDYFHSASNMVYSSKYGAFADAVVKTPKEPALPGPVVFDGVSHRLTGKNPLVFPVLTAEDTAFSLETGENIVIEPTSPFVGTKNVLVSAAQARNNARLIFTGDAKIFSDRYYLLFSILI